MSTFYDYLETKAFGSFLEQSAVKLAEKGMNPTAFYQYILEHPEILESDVALNESLGGLRSFAKGAGAAFGGMGAGGRASDAAQDVQYLKQLKVKNPQQYAQLGGDNALKNAERGHSQYAQDARSTFGQRFGRGYQQGQEQERQNRILGKWGSQDTNSDTSTQQDAQQSNGVHPMTAAMSQQQQQSQQQPMDVETLAQYFKNYSRKTDTTLADIQNKLSKIQNQAS